MAPVRTRNGKPWMSDAVYRAYRSTIDEETRIHPDYATEHYQILGCTLWEDHARLPDDDPFHERRDPYASKQVRLGYDSAARENKERKARERQQDRAGKDVTRTRQSRDHGLSDAVTVPLETALSSQQAASKRPRAQDLEDPDNRSERAQAQQQPAGDDGDVDMTSATNHGVATRAQNREPEGAISWPKISYKPRDVREHASQLAEEVVEVQSAIEVAQSRGTRSKLLDCFDAFSKTTGDLVEKVAKELDTVTISDPNAPSSIRKASVVVSDTNTNDNNKRVRQLPSPIPQSSAPKRVRVAGLKAIKIKNDTEGVRMPPPPVPSRDLTTEPKAMTRPQPSTTPMPAPRITTTVPAAARPAHKPALTEEKTRIIHNPDLGATKKALLLLISGVPQARIIHTSTILHVIHMIDELCSTSQPAFAQIIQPRPNSTTPTVRYPTAQLCRHAKVLYDILLWESQDYEDVPLHRVIWNVGNEEWKQVFSREAASKGWEMKLLKEGVPNTSTQRRNDFGVVTTEIDVRILARLPLVPRNGRLLKDTIKGYVEWASGPGARAVHEHPDPEVWSE